MVAKVSVGTVLVYVARFIFHLISGFLYFAEGAIWVDLPATNMFLYSFIYQCVYLPADCAICVGVLVTLAKTKTLDKLFDMMDKNRKKEVSVLPAAEESVATETDETQD